MTFASFVRRDACVVCGGGSLEPIVTIPSFPVFQGCVTFAAGADETAPMSWAACAQCGSAQITELPSLERVYLGGHATGLGQAWARHHAAFAQFVRAHGCGAVVDVGGGSGTLAAAYRRAGGDERWTVLEPNALPTADWPRDVDIVDGFLEQDALRRIGAQTVVMCHMLEHVTDLRASVQDLTAALAGDARIVVAWPVLEAWAAHGLAGALNFEHATYVTLPRLERLFAEFGWQIEAHQVWAENNTAFLSFVRGRAQASQIGGTHSAHDAVRDYFNGFQTVAAAVNDALRAHDGDAFFMPASVYAQALIASGLRAERFEMLIDNAAVKQGRRLYGTPLSVQAPREPLMRARRPLVVLNGGAHDAEMAAGLRAIRGDVAIVRTASMPALQTRRPANVA